LICLYPKGQEVEKRKSGIDNSDIDACSKYFASIAKSLNITKAKVVK
jgi:hypothetical protein